ncbi:MAG: uracil-DNA glycosylase [Phycisphaerae bacterium]|nr:uracil-DNA glycosylase [Phycisphaerae bacterium]
MHESRLAAQQRAMDRAFGVDLLDHARSVHALTAHATSVRSGSSSTALDPAASVRGAAVPKPRPLAPLGAPPSAVQASASPTAPRRTTAAVTEAIGIGGSGRRLELQGERQALLEALRERHASECPHCTRASGHTNLVFGEGSANAELVFVGEAPGETEDQTGRPFVGKAGQKLDEMIAAMKLRREQVYIANVLKSRPPNNRTPLQSEVDGCGPYLIEQLCILRPRVIVTLGGPATRLLLATEVGITRLRGAWGTWTAAAWTGLDLQVPVMPTYHPAYLLRNYTAQTRGEVWADLQAVMARLAG